MKTLHIDFAPSSLWRVIVRTPRLTWIVGGVGVLFCGSASVEAWHLFKQYDAMETELRRMQTELHTRTATKPVVKKETIPDAQAATVNKAIAQLNLPWRDALDAVESATPDTIALLALEPDARKRIIKGTAEAKTGEGMVAYVEELKKQAFFNGVVLIRHEVNEQDPNKPIRFQFEAEWMEPGQ